MQMKIGVYGDSTDQNLMDIETAIKKSIELLDREDFKNYNIIDLRVDGKIIVEE